MPFESGIETQDVLSGEKYPKVTQRCLDYQEKYGRLRISELTYYECLIGFKAIQSEKKQSKFEALVNEMEVISLSRDIYKKASEIYVYLRKKGIQPVNLIC